MITSRIIDTDWVCNGSIGRVSLETSIYLRNLKRHEGERSLFTG